jgi:Dolichyl-phosphate-mannose-protein mannosyltransferase
MYRFLRLAFPRVGQRWPTPIAWLNRLDRGTECVPLDPTAILCEHEVGHTHAWIARATWGFLALGLIIRLVRFLVAYPIWPDEAFVAANFLERGYLDLLRPLDYAQVCPFLFLWIELTVVRIFGFSEWSLRLFPALCGLASMVLFRHLAARVLRGIPLLLAVGIFATSLSPIRHSAEVKPYASDLLAALIFLVMVVEWRRSPERSRSWWVLAALAPVLLGLSYPSIFVATGSSLAVGPVVFRQRRRSVRWAYLIYNLMLLGSFLVIYLASTSGQSAAVRAAYRWGYWRDSFPPWEQPWKLVGWLIATHTGNMLAYPIGGANGASTATFAALTIGIVAFWRRGQRATLLVLLSPLAMGLAASSLGQYPYGGSSRITQYAAPSICVLTGLGWAALFARMRSPASCRRSARLAAVLLALLGTYFAINDLVHPYRSYEDLENRRFARWFWSEYGRGSDLLCARHDLGLRFEPKDWHSGMSAVYLCHQRFFAKRHAGKGFRQRRTWAQPMRLVFFDRIPQDSQLYHRWVADISAAYQIGDRLEFVVNPDKPVGDRSRYVVLEFKPRERPGPVARSLDGRERIRR